MTTNMTADEVARERWGKLPKTFEYNRRNESGRLLPDDFPHQQGTSAKSHLAFQQKVNEYFRVNGYKNGRFPWEIIVWEGKPTYEQYCEQLGENPDDDRNWENYCEFTNEWED